MASLAKEEHKKEILVGLIAAGLRQHSHSWLQSLEIHDQHFYSLLDMCMFRNEASSTTRGWVGPSM
jgi:hypothetical protein